MAPDKARRLPALVGNANIMYGLLAAWGFSQYSFTRSARIEGANGIQKSRFLMARLMVRTADAESARARIDRFPRARAPNSHGPFARATMRPPATASAVTCSISRRQR